MAECRVILSNWSIWLVNIFLPYTLVYIESEACSICMVNGWLSEGLVILLSVKVILLITEVIGRLILLERGVLFGVLSISKVWVAVVAVIWVIRNVGICMERCPFCCKGWIYNVILLLVLTFVEVIVRVEVIGNVFTLVDKVVLI